MRSRALKTDLDGEDKPKLWQWKNPFREWPRPAAKRSFVERALRKVWLFSWDRHATAFAATGIEYCQSIEYREEKLRRLFPKRYWLEHELPFLFKRPKWRWDKVYWWVRHRLPGRYWHHTLKLRLEPGYHDADTKMLHAVFEVIRWYVEVQLAHHCSEPEKYKWHGDRSPEAGLAHLDWEIADCSGAPAGSIGQGEAAQIKKDVYLWWTVDRPNRIDPHDLYHIVDPDYGKRKTKRMGIWSMMNDKSPNYTRAMWGSMALEEFYSREDQEMLTKATSILAHWWD